MKIAIMTSLLAKRDMYINARQRFIIYAPVIIGIIF